MRFIDTETLARLREFATAIKDHDGRGLPMARLVDMADTVKADVGVTIDFSATPKLGDPLLIIQVPESNQDASVLDVLSAREREVAALVVDGKSNKAIAAALGISLATVKDHVHHILEKTGFDRRSELIAAYGRRGR